GAAGGGTANSSEPHADSREMAFDANGNLIEVDDGGVYRRTNPQTNTGDWFSMIGNLQVTESHDVAYDTISNIILSGNQDTGSTEQISSGSRTWMSISTGDGGDVAVDNITLASSNQSIRYSSFQNLQQFQRRIVDINNNVVSTVFPALSVTGNSPEFEPLFDTPVILNSVDPTRLILGGNNGLYESTDQGDTITRVTSAAIPPDLTSNPIAYGGRSGGVDNPDVIYAGANDGNIHIRTTTGGAFTSTDPDAASDDEILDVRLDPDRWQTAFAVDTNQVFMTSTTGASWTDITGNLPTGSVLRSLEFINATFDAVVVGTNLGVFASLITTLGTWIPYGSGLPNVPVWDMDYDSADDLLVIGTLGRGVWTLPNAGLVADPTPTTPTMLGPVGTLSNPVPLFEWSPAANADHYELAVDNLTTNTTDFYTRSVVTTSHVAERQFIEGDYKARVRTVTATGSFSEWSNYVEFTIDVPAPLKPVVHRPAGNITDSFPTFGWTSDDGASTYTLWVSNATTGSRVIYRNAYTGTSYQHFSPLPDGIYRTWVQAFNAIGEPSPWSEPVDFTVDLPIPLAPNITAPAKVSSDMNLRIAWNVVEFAARYDLWVDNLTTGTSKFIRQSEISNTTPFFDTTDLPQGTFRAWVRAANGNNEFSPWSAPYTFTVDILPPSTPSIVGPSGVNGIVTTTNPTFRWTSADRAATYDLWVNNVTTGQAQIIRKQNLTGTEYVALTNLPQGQYHAWVRGINSVNEVGEWSARYTFTIDEPTPLIPVITAPVGGLAGSVSNTNPTFVWKSELNAPFYEFVLDDQTDRKFNVIRVNNLQTTSYTVPVSQTLVEHTYVAWVRARNNSGEASNWSAPFQVRIDIPNPTAPTIISPTATSKDTTPTFQWTHTTGAIRYEILVRNLERGEDIVLQVTTFTLDPTGQFSIYTLPNNKALDPGTYRFWIRAFNSLGTSSNWSSSKTFVISASLDVKDLKLVEPSRLLTAETFYAIADENSQASGNDPETDYTARAAEISVSVPPRAAVPAASDAAMPPTLIEEVMESLSDPASAASAMLSGSISSDSIAEPRDTSRRTMAATVFAVTMLPVRRGRRDESR
ncbi:MAG: hypothetical protein KDB01_00780, partial [Planctomycetaceae bacterium]|nr:hypothetical protein [Planctomycetaceae bacterium]